MKNLFVLLSMYIDKMTSHIKKSLNAYILPIVVLPIPIISSYHKAMGKIAGLAWSPSLARHLEVLLINLGHAICPLYHPFLVFHFFSMTLL